MNATMIQHREYVDQLRNAEEIINNSLIQYTEQFFGKRLSTKEMNELTNMDITDKQWLLSQYKHEVDFNNEPDLSDLY
jgi:hypothetical protein